MNMDRQDVEEQAFLQSPILSIQLRPLVRYLR